jgi:hypothetical protein
MREGELMNLYLRIRSALETEQANPIDIRDTELEDRMVQHMHSVEATLAPALAEALRETGIKPERLRDESRL